MTNPKFVEKMRSSDTELLLKKIEELSNTQARRFDEFSSKHDMVLDEYANRLNMQETSLKNLEVQVGQIA